MTLPGSRLYLLDENGKIEVEQIGRPSPVSLRSSIMA